MRAGSAISGAILRRSRRNSRRSSVDLVDYAAPTTATVMEPNVLRRLCRRGRQPIGVPKVLVRGSIGAGRVTVSAGNHTIRIDGQPHVSPPQDAFVLAHYPSRSPYHWAAKAAVGWLKVLAAGDAARGTALHYAEAFARLKRDPAEWIAEASANLEAMKSSRRRWSTISWTISAATPPTRGPVAYGWRAVGARAFGDGGRWPPSWARTLDADPDLHAQTRGRDHRFPPRASRSRRRCRFGRSHMAAWSARAWRRSDRPRLRGPAREPAGASWRSWGIWGVGEVHELRMYLPGSRPDNAEIDLDVAACFPGRRREASSRRGRSLG